MDGMEGRHVTLQTTEQARVSKRLKEYCGDEDGMVRCIEGYTLGMERLLKHYCQQGTSGNGDRSSALLSSSPLQSSPSFSAVMELAVLFFTCMGRPSATDPAHEQQATCSLLQPLLVRMVKVLTTACSEEGFAVLWTEHYGMDPGDAAEVVSQAMMACSGGSTRRKADMECTVALPPTAIAATEKYSSSEVKGKEVRRLTVRLGFGDFTSCETGAMLWPGSMGLTVWLLENWDSDVLRWSCPVSAGSSTASQSRVLEVGCGCGIVSLMLAKYLLLLEQEGNPRRHAWEVHATDRAAAVVAEVRKSCMERNPGELPLRAENDGKSGAVAPGGVGVRCFELDVCQIPAELYGSYRVVLGGDVVYDHETASLLLGSFRQLLQVGGIVVLCGEAQRDGMTYLMRKVEEALKQQEQHQLPAEDLEGWEVLQFIPDIEAPGVLKYFSMPRCAASSVRCVLVVLRKTAV